jgi:hypothetical protein
MAGHTDIGYWNICDYFLGKGSAAAVVLFAVSKNTKI